MKMRFCAALIAVGVVGCSVAAWGVCTPAEEKQIADVRNSWLSNWNAQKLDEVMKLYATDATFTPPEGSPISGRDNIRAYFAKQIGSTISVEPKPLECSGDTARDNGAYKEDVKGGVTITSGVTITPGTTITGGGKHVEGMYHVVLKRQRGKWLIAEQSDAAKP